MQEGQKEKEKIETYYIPKEKKIKSKWHRFLIKVLGLEYIWDCAYDVGWTDGWNVATKVLNKYKKQ